MMTWEQLIIDIRQRLEYSLIVEKSYFEENLQTNVDRFKKSEEYLETLGIIKNHGGIKKIADIGSGNGISAVSFALDGFSVTAVEPDKSYTIGSGAIRRLKEAQNLTNLDVIDSFGESLPFADNSFDMVYIRQAMHHAAHLDKFVSEASRILKRGGLFLTVRDHVIYNAQDKASFLLEHPLHKFYGGENAFTEKQYLGAMKKAKIEVKKILRYYDSVINYYPLNENDLSELLLKREKLVIDSLKRKLGGMLSGIGIIKNLYSVYVRRKLGPAKDERIVPGRMYSFIGVKR